MSILDTMATTARVRPLLWLAEACVACGVQPYQMAWQGYPNGGRYIVQCRSVDDLERLAGHLALPGREYRRPSAPGIVYARGAWMDEVRVELFAGLPAEPPVSWPTDVDSELLAANPDPVDDVIVDDLWIGYEGESP